METITEYDLQAAHRGLQVLRGNYTDGRAFIFTMDNFIDRAANAGHVMGQIVTIEADRTLVVLLAEEEEKWFPISKQDLKALGVGGCMPVHEGGLDVMDETGECEPRGSYVFIKDNKITLVF